MTDLHDELIVIDGLMIVSNWSCAVFEDMRQGGLTAANCTCCVCENFAGTMRNIGAWKRWFVEDADLIMPVRRAADIEEAKRAGKTGFQNTSASQRIRGGQQRPTERCGEVLASFPSITASA
jgi:membrane dipeptidase